MNNLKTLITSKPNIKNIIFDIGGVLLQANKSSSGLSFIPIEKNVILLKELQKNYRLFCITDASSEQVKKEIHDFDFFTCFEDIITSDNCGFKKASAEIYVHCLNKHKLIDVETLFIDDREENVNAAKKAGLNVIKYQGSFV